MAATYTTEIRECFFDTINSLDSEQEYVIANKKEDQLSYTSRIKCKERISGKPSDEELTRALILLNLIKNYKYSAERIIIEDRFEMAGRNKQRARAYEGDIMILEENLSDYKALIEVKSFNSYKGVNDSMIDLQLFKALNINPFSSAKELYFVTCDVPINNQSFPLKCIGIDAQKYRTYTEWKNDGKVPDWLDFRMSQNTDDEKGSYVKLNNGTKLKTNQYKDLNDSFGMIEIRRAWRNVWNAIWGGTLESNKKFENFNKLLLAKIYDERKTLVGTQYMFQKKYRNGKFQTDEELSYDVDLLYRKAYIEYLSKDKSIDLKDIKGIDFTEFRYELINICVEELSKYSFDKNKYNNIDILGEFYEMVILESFKQTKGLFLTHPNIVLFIISVIDSDCYIEGKIQNPDQDPRFRLPFVIDIIIPRLIQLNYPLKCSA